MHSIDPSAAAGMPAPRDNAKEQEAAPDATSWRRHARPERAGAGSIEQEQELNRQEPSHQQPGVAERLPESEAIEARRRDLAAVASDWLWEIDADCRFTFVSKRFTESSGVAWEQIVGLRCGELVGLGFDRAGMATLLSTIAARDAFHDCIYRVAPSGQAMRFWMLSGDPYFDTATGGFTGYRGTGTDVTARIEREAAMTEAVRRAEMAEQEARAARIRLVDAIEAIPEGFVLHDADDRLVLCNARYGEIYGLTAELMTPGVRFEDVLRGSAGRGTFVPDGDHPDEWIARRLALHRTANRDHFEQRLTNGRWLQVAERRTSDGGTVGILVDVTAARQREAIEREREKLTALGHLARGASHEINNLLQPALVFPALVRERLPPDDFESREDLDCVLDSVRKVSGIIRDVALFARNDEPVLTKLDMVRELRAALGFVRDLMRPAITLRAVDLDRHPGCLVAANKTQLIQVLTNLVVNAAQATKGTATITVATGRSEPSAEAAERLSIEPGRAYLTVAVTDTGNGMDAATQARVFEPFFTTKPIGQGTGLGLSAVHGILRSWHGAVTVQSTPGVGSTFTLYLPIVEAGDGL
jgi:signal transduction histidine kinase